MKRLEFHVPSRIILGMDSLSRLGSLAEAQGTRALLVADSILADGPLPERIAAILEQRGVQLITHQGIPSDAPHNCLEGGTSLAKASRTQIILGLGGIRTLSVAKAIAALAMGDCRPDEFLDGASLPRNRLKYIEIPTTCRNPFMLRDEVLFIDSRNRRSRIITIPGFLPEGVVLDPNTAATLSPKYSFATLMDSFLFALEGLISDRSNYLSDSLFLKAMARVAQAVKLTETSEDQDIFREYAFQAGFTTALGLSSSSLGAGSSLSFVLAERLGLPKSLLGAMLIPEVLEGGAIRAPEKLARLAPILDEDTRGMIPQEAARRAVEVVRQLLGKTIGELKLTDISLSQDAAVDTAIQVSALPYLANGPGVLTTEDIVGMIQRSFH